MPPPSDCYQDRATAHQLDQAMTEAGGAVLVGMGGVGKTQLAARQARALWQSGQLDLLVWITAATREAVISGYAQAAVEVLDADPTDPETDAQAFLAWLEPKPAADQRRWLVVLDDLADPADLRDLWPPASPHGHTLVTTRRRDAALTGSSRRLVSVGLFTADEAVTYLTTILAAHDHPEPADQLTSLAEDLGYLPLALSQAAAYLIDADLDCATYRDQLANRASTLTTVLPEPYEPDDQPTTLAVARSLSLHRADQLRPVGLARPMLQLAAMLDPNGIPAPVLESPPALAYLAQHRTAAAAGQAYAGQVALPDARGALRALHRLSLVDHTPDTPHEAVRVHQLLQRAIRDSLTPQERDLAARAAADALITAWPDVERDTALVQALRANADALTHHAEEALYQADTAHPVLFRTSRSLAAAGQIKAAVDHCQHLVSATKHHLGPDHPRTLTARLNLASWRGKAGDPAGAIAALEQVLTDMLRVLGPDHPITLTTRHNLAHCRGDAGDAAGALAAYEQLLTDQERVLGPDDPDTLNTRRNLACSRAEAGDAAGAVSAYEQVLTDMLWVLGPDHPDTLTTRNDLAYSRGEAGDAPGAVAAYEQLLSDKERVLGPDHPDTLSTRLNLAWFRGEAGDAAGAVADFEQLLTDTLRVLGPDHPTTLTARPSVAYWRGELGDAAGALAAYEQLLSDRERVLGPDHPDTLNARTSVAYWRGEAGDVAGAVAAYEQLLSDKERVLGPGHPDTLNTRHKLAHWQGEAGEAIAHGATDS
ncbi:tetratricopeptide repeat protein [Streptomyces coeruleorubidus]|uniref:Tetratricopeptide repeat protein n=1 Tax=Streptomyces coeruleorubidus TaxID=116188 RepID=A0ABZ0KSM5_STRC4|nr:tetratricopeptide repeat protein [Streptomyces coeruleorubidus]WOT40733.1 tetratricopeptide repeat protein [Streptomyces coeruleorubidus]